MSSRVETRSCSKLNVTAGSSSWRSKSSSASVAPFQRGTLILVGLRSFAVVRIGVSRCSSAGTTPQRGPIGIDLHGLPPVFEPTEPLLHIHELRSVQNVLRPRCEVLLDVKLSRLDPVIGHGMGREHS